MNDERGLAVDQRRLVTALVGSAGPSSFPMDYSAFIIHQSSILMKIVYLASGAGAMYCGSCIHANTLAAALVEAGQDVLLAPLYTPIHTDEPNVSIDRMAFGGINVYLQQKSPLFRRTPWFVDRLLDRPALLRWLGERAGSTRPESLGELTVSMLQGEEGQQRKELEKLLHWLEREIRPDVVHLSNVLLVGVARQIRRRLGVPVVCTLSGEDAFLEKLPEPHCSKARSVLRERCGELDALVALSRYFADFMAAYLEVDRERIRVIPPGLNLEGHRAQFESPPPAPAGDSERKTVKIGYLGRICPEKGLHLLAEAFEQLADDAELPPLRLLAAGYLGPSDRPYLAGIESRLTERGLGDRFRCLGEPDRAAKIAFLQLLDVMSAPSVHPDSKGFSALEAWANGVPVVLPDHGAFPELVEDTGGGLLAKPGDPAALAGALKQLIQDPKRAAECGRRAQAAVRERYNSGRMAETVIELYGEVVDRPSSVD
jgi:glycosyltransferase involved in cell wall biosynthesis